MKKKTVVVIYSILFFICIVLIFVAHTETKIGNINWGVIALVVILCHLVANLRTVSEREQAISVLFGKILEPMESGLHFVPWPMRMVKATKNSIKVDFGTLNVEDEGRAAKANESQSWFVMPEPIRMNWGDIKSSEGLSPEERKRFENDPLAQRLTTDPHMYFIFRISNLSSLVSEAGGLDEAMDRIKDTCVTALQEQAGKTFVAKAIRDIDPLSDRIRERVEDLVGDPQGQERLKKLGKTTRSWGVDVYEVRIKDLGTPHRTNTAVADRASAIAVADGEATGVRLKAAGEEERLKRTADGKSYEIKTLAGAEKKRLEKEGAGRAAAFKARSEAVGTDQGPLLARLDALTTGLQYGKTVILPADASLLTAALSIKEALGITNTETKKGE